MIAGVRYDETMHMSQCLPPQTMAAIIFRALALSMSAAMERVLIFECIVVGAWGKQFGI